MIHPQPTQMLLLLSSEADRVSRRDGAAPVIRVTRRSVLLGRVAAVLRRREPRRRAGRRRRTVRPSTVKHAEPHHLLCTEPGRSRREVAALVRLRPDR